jgi:hypothetical protein
MIRAVARTASEASIEQSIASSPLRGSPPEISMHRSRPVARTILLLVSSLGLIGCVATTSPSIPIPSAGPIRSSTLPPVSSGAPIGSVAPIGSSRPVDPPGPTDLPEPTPAPTPRPSQIAGCGTGEAGFIAHASEIPQTLHFGGATIEYTSAGVGMRDGSWPVDDVIPGGVGLTADEIAVVVGPGDHIILRGPGITLVDTQASASAWSQVTFSGGLASLGGPKTALDWRLRSDGSLSISAPTTTGDWAVEFLPQWHGDCLKGDGTAYARIKVR